MSRKIRSVAVVFVFVTLVSGTAAHALPGWEGSETAEHAGILAAVVDWLLHWSDGSGHGRHGLSEVLAKDGSHLDPNGNH